MLVSEAISRINYAFRGLDDVAPEEGNDEYSLWVDTLNRKKDELYTDTRYRWSNLYAVREVGTVTASSELVFDLDDDFLAPSAIIYTENADGQRNYFDFIHPEERANFNQSVFIKGQNPQQLVFNEPILSSSQLVGADVFVPAYWLPDDVSSSTDELPFLDANWAIMATAAELAFNDVVYETKAPDLQAKADSLLRAMKARNQKGTYNNPRKTPTNVHRIRGY